MSADDSNTNAAKTETKTKQSCIASVCIISDSDQDQQYGNGSMLTGSDFTPLMTSRHDTEIMQADAENVIDRSKMAYPSESSEIQVGPIDKSADSEVDLQSNKGENADEGASSAEWSEVEFSGVQRFSRFLQRILPCTKVKHCHSDSDKLLDVSCTKQETFFSEDTDVA